MEIDFTLLPNQGLPCSAHRKLREAGSVVWSETLGGWLVSSYADARKVLADVARFTNQGTPVAEQLGTEGMLMNDTPLHHVMRSVWAESSSRTTLEARRAELEGNAARVLDRVRQRLETGEAVDLIPVLQAFAIEFIASSFGISRDRLTVFERWARMSADAPVTELAEGSEAQASHRAIKAELLDLIRQEILDRRTRFGRGDRPDDLISLMATAEGSHGITRPMVVDNIFNFIIGPLDTTEKWIGNVIVKLCSSPELRAEVCADPSLLEPILYEVMRFDTVVQVLIRRVKPGGAELGGQRMNEGDQVFVMLGAANRDPAMFDNADAFDFRRPLQPNIGFGFGLHHCLGINMAAQEALAFIRIFLDRFPDLTVVECDFGNSWALWGPRKLHVALNSKSAKADNDSGLVRA